MAQKSRGVVTGLVVVENIKPSMVPEVLKKITPSLRISNAQLKLNANKTHRLEFDVRYGPVAGGWQSDVVRHVRNALVKSGTTATCMLRNYERIAFPR